MHSLEKQAVKKRNLEQKSEDSRSLIHKKIRNIFHDGQKLLNDAKMEAEKYRSERLAAEEATLKKIEQATK
jgi:5-bromo-4-chloroindolyl phosphate hydrolysis protein